MEVQITGKGIDLGEALQNHVSDKIESGVHKYFGRPVEAHVTFAREGSQFRCESTAHLASGVFLTATGAGGDVYGAFDEALERLEKRVRRYKRRLKDHHADNKKALPAENASSYVLQALEADEEGDAAITEDPQPVIVAENTTKLRHMSVGAAVLQLDLTDEPVLMFKNAVHGGVNVVFKRTDGNVGWIDSATL